MMNAVTKVSAKGQVVIPKDVRDRLGFHAGDTLEVIETAGGALLRREQPRKTKTVEEAVAEMRKIYQHKGPPISIEEMDKAVEEAVAERWRQKGF